jgi:predicted transcriptional regulator
MEAKQTVRDLLDKLPDDCSIDDVLYHLYVLQRISRGLADAEAGRVTSHSQVQEELRKRWASDA